MFAFSLPLWASNVKTAHFTWSESTVWNFTDQRICPICVCNHMAEQRQGQKLRLGHAAAAVCVCTWRSGSAERTEREKFCLPTWLRVLCDFCSHTLHWSYSLIDMPLHPYACLRTQPKNCLSSRRRVEFCSPGLRSHEPLCSRSGRGKGVGGGREGVRRTRQKKQSRWRKEEVRGVITCNVIKGSLYYAPWSVMWLKKCGQNIKPPVNIMPFSPE